MTIVTPEQLNETVTNSITKTVMSAMQTAQNQYTSFQNLDIECDIDVNNELTIQTKRCIEYMSGKKYSKADILKYCNIPVYCSANNISMKSTANINNLTKQMSQITSKVKNSVSNNISQGLSSMNPGIMSLIMGGNSDITQKIGNITSIVNTNITEIVQGVYNSVLQEQVLTLRNYQASNVDMNSVSKVTNNILQSNTSYQSNLTDILNAITQSAKSSDNSLSSWIQIIFIITIIIIVIIFIVIFFLKRRNTREFAAFILPYVIFIGISSIIVVINIKVKPKWILKKTNNKLEEIDLGRFLFFTIIPILLVGIGEYLGIKYYLKKKSGNGRVKNETEGTETEGTEIDKSTEGKK